MENEKNKENNVWQTLERGMDIIDASPTKENMFSWFDEDFYGMSFEDLCKLDDDERKKVIEEKTGRKIEPNAGTICIGGTPYRKIKTIEDVEKKVPYPTQKQIDIAMQYLEEVRQMDHDMERELIPKPTFLKKAKTKLKKLIRK